MKAPELEIYMPELLEQALAVQLFSILSVIPGLEKSLEPRKVRPDKGSFDFQIHLESLPSGGRAVLCVVCKSQPRPSQFPFDALRKGLLESNTSAVPVLAAPHVSARMADLCQEKGWSWLDQAGNCRLMVPGGLYIERSGHLSAQRRPKPKANLSTSASARVLRALLVPEHSGRAWTQTDLKKACTPDVSSGLVHKVVSYLREEAWLLTREDGKLQLADPMGLAKAWSQAYRFNRHRRIGFFTLLKKKEMDERLASAFPERGVVAYAAFTAADEQAPHVRQNKTWLYVRDWDLVKVQNVLEATVVATGENLVVLIPEDEGVFSYGSREGLPGPEQTNPLQTWLDLRKAGGRGEEAAEAIHRKRLAPAWEGHLLEK